MNRFNKLTLTNVVLLALALGGCASANYTSPAKQSNQTKLTATLNHSFDVAWSALVDYAGSSCFVIEDMNKSTGVLTLSFAASHADEYINCGTFNDSSPELNYSGPYTGFLEQYAGAKLHGKMTVSVKEFGPKQTNVSIKASYLFTAQLTEPAAWAFDSASFSTITLSAEQALTGKAQARTCRPTHKAEDKMMQVINSLH